MNNTRRLIARVGTLFLIVCTLALIYWNYSTTLMTLERLLGTGNVVTFFAFAVAAIDIAGIALMSEFNEKDSWRWILGIVWFIALCVDFFLTGIWASWRMQGSGAINQLAQVIPFQFAIYAPWAIAVIELTLRIPLCHGFANFIDNVRSPSIPRGRVANLGGMQMPAPAPKHK